MAEILSRRQPEAGIGRKLGPQLCKFLHYRLDDCEVVFATRLPYGAGGAPSLFIFVEYAC
jgi:hypothetical protein